MPSGGVITGAGIAVAGAGALLIWMGLQDYSLTTVINAAVRGDPLVSELQGDNVGAIRNIKPDAPVVPGPGPIPGGTPSGPTGDIPAVFHGFPKKGVDGINWDGGFFDA